jgi:hypothetical protein
MSDRSFGSEKEADAYALGLADGRTEMREEAARLVEERMLPVKPKPRPTIKELEEILAAPREAVIEIDENGEVRADVPLARAIRSLPTAKSAEEEK